MYGGTQTVPGTSIPFTTPGGGQTIPGTDLPLATPENIEGGAGFVHGARQAVNPLLEWGSGVGNWIGRQTGLNFLQGDRTAADVANEQAFQKQYGGSPAAQAGAVVAATPRPSSLVAPRRLAHAPPSKRRACLSSQHSPRGQVARISPASSAGAPGSAPASPRAPSRAA